MRTLLRIAILSLILPPATWAANILQADFSAEVLGGCTSSECTSGSTNATTEIVSEGLNTYQLRYGLNVNADDGAGSGFALETGIVNYTTTFSVGPGNYIVGITAERTGALRRNADASGCEGSISLGEASATISIDAEAGPDLSALDFPAAEIATGGGDADLAIANGRRGRNILMNNQFNDVFFSLTYTMSAVALSDSCEVSARLGAPNGQTTGCSACEYPGDGNRVLEDDGLFVTIEIIDLCGDGEVQAPEQCDLGERNGDRDACCNTDCSFKSSEFICRGSTDASACDPFEVCSGDSAFCPTDITAPEGTACEDDGDPCTDDVCDTSGQCLHVDTPEPCAERCGNGSVDPGEECDLGKSENGLATNCCDADCLRRPNGSSCTDEFFCNGEESCSDGICTVASTNPCVALPSCAFCDEVNNVCDASACPSPSVVPTDTRPPTPTATATPPPSSTPGGCIGDCDGDGSVSIGELITGVNIALGTAPIESCPAFDANGDGAVSVNELIAAVNSALNGC